MRSALAVVVAVAGCHGSSSLPAPVPTAAPLACIGQRGETATAATGDMAPQLSPGFLDRMAACDPARAAMPAAQVTAEAGVLDDKGECQWPGGVSCHFHAGAEFVVSTDPVRPAVGELHCILPVAGDPKSPRVFGTHFRCKPGTAMPSATTAAIGAACGAGLLPALAARIASAACDARCCEDGTLTTTTAVRTEQGKLDVRPDFRMCAADDDALDCAPLAPLLGHPANSPHFGPPVTNTF